MEQVPSKREHFTRLILILVVLLVAVCLVLVIIDRPKSSPATQPESTTSLHSPVVQPRLIVTGLQSPTAIVSTNQPSDKRLFVVERKGVVNVLDTTKQSKPKVFLNIASKVFDNQSEMGLLGLTFHPKYSENNTFYVNYIDKQQNTIIARYYFSPQTGLADPKSEKILFKLKQPYSNHNGGDLAFGPDGYLYIAVGDGGSAGDPENRAQNTKSFFGKILRIDVDSGDPYSIPASNPFVGKTGKLPEIWSLGLRNPWRISFNKLTGDLYIADVGQGKLEEVNLQKKDSKGGENYGWRCYEGNQTFKSSGCLEVSKYIAPILEYDHSGNKCSITGGYVYTGESNPALKGKYFYGDFCSGQIFYTSEVNGKWEQIEAAKTPYAISAFGQDSDGELYFADLKTGSIYKIQDVNN